MKLIIATILTLIISVTLYSQNLQISYYNSRDSNDDRIFYLDVINTKAKFYSDKPIVKLRHLNENFYDIKWNTSYLVIPKSENLGINENYLVPRDLPKKWELKNESKLILGLTCNKATSTYYDLIAGETVPVEIWYTTKFKNKIGPLGFIKTPGLVLEINSKSYNLSAKNIKEKYKAEPILFPDYKHSTNTEISKMVSSVFKIDSDK